MAGKQISIVIPVYNHWRMTASCLASIFKSDIPKDSYEIIVVDNASTDMTPKLLSYLQDVGEPLKIVRNKENKDYLLAANQGWKLVETPYVLHLNNDVTLDPHCISLMLNPFVDSQIGIVGAVQYFLNGTREPPLRWFYRGDQNVGNLYRTELTKEQEEMSYVECDVVGFACAMVKREVWKSIGYFDEQFAPSMYEQEDYCLRAKKAGFKTVLVPNAYFVHRVAVTTADNPAYYQKVIRRNRELFRKKWGEKLRNNEI